ncbi:MAG: hypothetical protein WAW06_12850 [bacterium]
MSRVILILVAGLAAVAASTASLAGEVQIPFDYDGKVPVLTRELEARLELFPKYQGFKEARLFQISDTSFVLEVYYGSGEQVEKDRTAMSAAEVSALRASVAEAIAVKAPDTGLDQSGRTAFLVGTAALSLGFYGWAVPVAFDFDDGPAIAGTYMVTSGAGFFAPFLLTRHRAVTDGAATLSLYGGTRGIVHGALLPEIFSDEDIDGDDRIAGSLFTSLAEYAAGYIIADRASMTAGTAEAICAGGDMGLLSGLVLRHMNDDGDDADAAYALAGSGVGLAGGYLLARMQPYTRGDAYTLRATASLGAYVGWAMTVDEDDEDSDVALAGLLVGEAAGVAAGHYLVRGRDFTTGQGVLMHVGQLAGGLFALGVVFLIDHDIDSSRPVTLSTSAGGIGGFLLTYHFLKDDAKARARDGSWNLEISPEILLALAARDEDRSPSDRARSIPIIRLRRTF